jgi:hypothetical protein
LELLVIGKDPIDLTNPKMAKLVKNRCPGVPEGSVLGPLMFVVFINDIDKAVKCVETIKKFADDT